MNWKYSNLPEEKLSDTVSLTSIYTVLGIIAKFGLKVAQIDFAGAFLYAKLKEKDIVCTKMPPDVVKLYVQIHPEYKNFVFKDGSMIVRVEGALYGQP